MNLKPMALTATVAVALITGCASDPNRTFSQRWSDRMTTDRVEDALKDAPVYKYPAVTVTTVDGVVQLSGFVALEQQKQQAEQIATGLPGVREVINNISLRPELAPTGRGGVGAETEERRGSSRDMNEAETDHERERERGYERERE